MFHICPPSEKVNNMLKHFALCLLFIGLLGCAVDIHPVYLFSEVSFWDVRDNPKKYYDDDSWLIFEAVTTQVSNHSVMLKTNREHIKFTIESGGALVRSIEDGKAVPLRLNQKYKFRCKINAIQHNLPSDDRMMPTVHILAGFLLTNDKKKVQYPPILID